MSAKHTPGPWHWPHDSNDLCPVNPDPYRSAVSSILTADGGYGFLGSSTADTLAELDADRRLIAAAPELLEALREAMDAVKTFHGPDCWEIYEQHSPEMKRWRAVIAKATGSEA